MRVIIWLVSGFVAALTLFAIVPPTAHAAPLASRLYVLATYQNANQLYLGTSDGTQPPTWTPLQVSGSTVNFADNGVTTLANPANPPTLYIAATGPDGTPSILAYQPYAPSLRTWIAIPAANNCTLQALTYLRGTLFIACYGPVHATDPLYSEVDITINAYNIANGTWGGWQVVGGYLMGLHGTWYDQSVKLANDGQNVFLVSQSPDDTNHINDGGKVWYTTYTFGAGVVAAWHALQTTCSTTPAVAYRMAQRAYLLACASGGVWWNSIAWNSPQEVGSWRPFDTPAGSLGYVGQGPYGGATLAVATNSPNAPVYVAGIFAASLDAASNSVDTMVLCVPDPASYLAGAGNDWVRSQQPQIAQLAIDVFV